MPPPVGRRTRVENRRALHLIEHWDMAMPEQRDISLSGKRCDHHLAGRTPTVAMYGTKSMFAHREPDPRRQRVLHLVIVIVANHREHWRDHRQFFKHVGGVDIAEMYDQSGPGPPEQVHHRGREFPRAMGIDMGIRN